MTKQYGLSQKWCPKCEKIFILTLSKFKVIMEDDIVEEIRIKCPNCKYEAIIFSHRCSICINSLCKCECHEWRKYVTNNNDKPLSNQECIE